MEITNTIFDIIDIAKNLLFNATNETQESNARKLLNNARNELKNCYVYPSK